MRFYEDCRFQTGFVSHGPGCDDLSSTAPSFASTWRWTAARR
ncbi:MAG: hypothetical protein M5U34_35135 [Chloroflexi bacterium]|nr:hypothetical protein [Chloroflexota bacterium]